MEEGKDELPKPILLEDLGMLFYKDNIGKKYKFGLFRCGFCGTEFKARISAVKRGNNKSCGCYRIQRLKETITTHNQTNTRIYKIWKGIKGRTLNPKYKYFHDYGGRGITMCEEWKDDFMSFYNWAMSNGYSDELSIDRIDNDGNYEPSNCRWTTQSIQCRNQRTPKNNKTGFRGVVFIEISGKYCSKIYHNKKGIHIGLYPTAEDGAVAYNNYIIANNLEGFPLNKLPDSHIHLQLPTKPHHQTLE